jgi:hypothetical protein
MKVTSKFLTCSPIVRAAPSTSDRCTMLAGLFIVPRMQPCARASVGARKYTRYQRAA